MSKASLQFLEMVREAAVKIESDKNKPVLRNHYCPVCGQFGDHQFTHESGGCEYYRCPNCGLQHGYRVR